MTQDEIIEMAQECGLIGMRPHLDGIYAEALEAFAKLVAAKATASEREACAKVCEELPAPNFYSDTDKSMWDITSMDCSEAIRARGEQA